MPLHSWIFAYLVLFVCLVVYELLDLDPTWILIFWLYREAIKKVIEEDKTKGP